jgi:hypothetical protein
MVIVHEPSAPPETAAGTIPPESIIVEPPTGALTKENPQESVGNEAPEMVTPEAKLTVTAAELSVLNALLKIEILTLLASPGFIVAGLKARLSVAEAKDNAGRNPKITNTKRKKALSVCANLANFD